MIKQASLPDGWRRVRLGTVCNLVADNLNPQQQPEVIFAHYSIPAFDADDAPTLEAGAVILSNKLEFPRGAVLFSKLNPRISRVWYVNDNHAYRRICSTEFLPLLPISDSVMPVVGSFDLTIS
jgi:type I restriction enzyme S subunit